MARARHARGRESGASKRKSMKNVVERAEGRNLEGWRGWIPNPNYSKQTGRGVNMDVAKEIREAMNPMM